MFLVYCAVCLLAFIVALVGVCIIRVSRTMDY